MATRKGPLKNRITERSSILSMEKLEQRILLSSDLPLLAIEPLATEPFVENLESVPAVSGQTPLDWSVEDASNGAALESAQDVIDEWRQYFPTESYVVWEKDSLWDSLDDRLQTPPSGVELLENINLDMGRNEYEPTSFVLTNLSGGPLTFDLSHDSPQIGITFRKGIWVYRHDGSTFNEALTLVDDNQLVIPSGESVEIWITLQGNDVAAGQHGPTITIASAGLSSHDVDLRVTVHDVFLPPANEMELNTYYWDDVVIDPADPWDAYDPETVEDIMQDLKAHYVNTPTIHPFAVPRFTVSGGQVVKDYSILDATLDAYEALDVKVFKFEMLSFIYFEPNEGGRPPFMSEQWKTLFRDWLTSWIDHMKARGLGYDDYIIQPYDERNDENVYQMHKLIKETDPQVQLVLNDMGHNFYTTVQDIINIAPYVDVWMPYLFDYYNYGAYVNNEAKDMARQLLGPAVTDTELIANGDMELVSGANLIANADMEIGDPPINWSSDTAVISAETSIVYEGSQSLRVQNLGSQIVGSAVSDSFAVEGGVDYDFSFESYGIDTDVYVGIYIDAGSGTYMADLGGGVNTWGAYNLTRTMPAGATTAEIRFFPTQPGSTVIIDNASFAPSGVGGIGAPDSWIADGTTVDTSSDTPDGSSLSILINNDGGVPYATSASQTSLPVNPDTEYTLSFWHKGDVRWELIDQASNMIGAGHLSATEWTYYTTTITTNVASTSMNATFYDLDVSANPLLMDNVSIISLESAIENTVLNGDMEVGDPPDFWLVTDATLSANTADSYDGAQSLQIVSDPTAQGYVEQTFTVEGSGVYSISFASKGIDSDVYYELQPDVGGTFFGTAESTNVWKETSFDWIAPEGATSATITFSPDGIGKTGLIDNVTVAVNRPDKFWNYANVWGRPMDPYQDYRVLPWMTWREGMTGTGYWIYANYGRWDQRGTGQHNWAVVYTNWFDSPPEPISTQELITPSKRWEGNREGVEDYAYLYMLQSLIDNSTLPPGSSLILDAESTLAYWTQMVPDNDTTDYASQAKVDIMEAIITLTPNLSGDFNNDTNVDGDDLVIWQGNFGTTDGASLSDGDDDADGDVDGADFLSWQQNYGSGTGIASTGLADASSSNALAVIDFVDPRPGAMDGAMKSDSLVNLGAAVPFAKVVAEHTTRDAAYPLVNADVMGDVDSSNRFDAAALSAFAGLVGGPASATRSVSAPAATSSRAPMLAENLLAFDAYFADNYADRLPADRSDRSTGNNLDLPAVYATPYTMFDEEDAWDVALLDVALLDGLAEALV